VAEQIQLDIVVKGKRISPFSHLSISQTFNGHHRFELRFNHDVLEKEDALIFAESQGYLGELISITLKDEQHPDLGDNIFKGIVTEIGFENRVGSTNCLVFSGYSPTILLDASNVHATFTAKSLSAIARDLLGQVPSNLLSTSVQPVFKGNIPYVVQYGESAFQFLRRLAAQFGEWFFYDGTSLHFGKPSNAKSFGIKYPHHISDLSLQMRATPLKMEELDYYSKNNEKFNASSASLSVAGLDKFGSQSQKVSDSIFSQASYRPANRKTLNKSELDNTLKARKAAQAAGMVTLSGTSDTHCLRPGAIMSITATTQLQKGNVKEENYGRYLVVETSHSIHGTGNYQNHFQAIPAALEIVPNPHNGRPEAEPQLGIVKDNKDPDKLGRVRVQLLWQKDRDMTPWIKVMSPHAGERTGGAKNRGLFFTPEVNDYVVVGFTHGDPDRPFVLGSVHHGKSIDSAKNTDNSIKAITTRSGNTIYLKDKDDGKEQEIVIKTDDANLVSIQVRNGDGTVKILSTKDVEVTSDKNVKVKSDKITIEAGSKLEMKAQEISIQATGKLEAKGAQVTLEGSGSAKVKGGGTLDLEGGGMANLKAGLVKIN
jgi:type VI secretion system secreted protein VgrG